MSTVVRISLLNGGSGVPVGWRSTYTRLIIRLANSQVAALSREFNMRLIPSAQDPPTHTEHAHFTNS